MFDIVMPLFNKEQYVARTIESVLSQSYADWRLIIVDDSSTDGSAAVARSFGDPRITCLHQPNAGPGAARNTGILAGSSDWIAFLDADDLWLDDHLEALDEVRCWFPDAVLIGSSYLAWSGGDVPRLSRDARTARPVRYFKEASQGRRPFFTSSAAFSRNAVMQIGLLKPIMMSDETEYWARLALHGPVAASTAPTVLYRVETGGLTDSYHYADRMAPGRVKLEDVSPPLATVMDGLETVTDRQLRQDIAQYVDYELGIALLRALRQGRIDYARKLLKLFLRGPAGKARVAAILARLPAPLGQQLLSLMFAAKRAIRGVVGLAGIR